MIKLFAIGIWVCAVALGSSYFMASAGGMKSPAAEAEEATYFAGLDYRQTESITVPIITENEIKGYVLARFVYTIDGQTLAALAVPPDPFVVDEAFRAIYSVKGFDFKRPERYDLDRLKGEVRAAVNERFGSDLVRDVLIEQFDYIDRKTVRGS